MRRFTIATSVFVSLGLLLLLCTGCGLVFLPRVQQFPGPIDTIRVVDAQSHRDIPSASLRYEIIPHGITTCRRTRLASVCHYKYGGSCSARGFRAHPVHQKTSWLA